MWNDTAERGKIEDRSHKLGMLLTFWVWGEHGIRGERSDDNRQVGVVQGLLRLLFTGKVCR